MLYRSKHIQSKNGKIVGNLFQKAQNAWEEQKSKHELFKIIFEI
jgi:hypothetical protein